jgi:DNA helicase-2/ATP-dependent DNA helicase PcrA
MSRFLKEMPEEILSGIDEKEEKNTFKDVQSDWKYGNGKVKTYKEEIKETPKNSTGFAFKTAENFLNSLSKKATNTVDLSKYKSGVRVYHKKFGEGTILFVEQEGDDLKVDISFDKVGNKRLMAKYANLEII